MGSMFPPLPGTVVATGPSIPFMNTQPAVAPPAPPAPAPFVPTFLDAKITSTFGGTWTLNPSYFASPETAYQLMTRYHAIAVKAMDFEGSGGPFVCDTAELQLVFMTLHGPVEVNAGLLAKAFIDGPENKFPGYADSKVREALARRGVAV